MEFTAKLGKPVIIVAPEFKSDALTSMVVNHLSGKIRVAAVKTPMGDTGGHLSVLEDLAAFTGGRVVTQALGERICDVDPVTVLGRTSQV